MQFIHRLDTSASARSRARPLAPSLSPTGPPHSRTADARRGADVLLPQRWSADDVFQVTSPALDDLHEPDQGRRVTERLSRRVHHHGNPDEANGRSDEIPVVWRKPSNTTPHAPVPVDVFLRCVELCRRPSPALRERPISRRERATRSGPPPERAAIATLSPAERLPRCGSGRRGKGREERSAPAPRSSTARR